MDYAKVLENMPVLAGAAGVWDGTYRHFDAGSRLVDEHAVRLLCRVADPQLEPYRAVQTNLYTWADGRREVRTFEGTLRDGRMWFDNALIRGWSGDLDWDQTKRTHLVYWVRTDEADVQFYEMINLSPCGRYKNRVWQWYRNGRLDRRTLVDEVLVERDWRRHDRPEYTAHLRFASGRPLALGAGAAA